MEHASLRERVIILLMCSAGLRVGGVTTLSIGDLRRIDKYNIYELTVYRGLDEEYKTYCTLESTAAIDSYLEYRRVRLGEQITDDSPLVVNLTDKENGYTRTNMAQRMTVKNIQRTIHRLLKDIGMRRAENKKVVQGQRHATAICHSLRKFFASQLEHADMKDSHMSHLTINEEARLQQKVQKLTAEQDRIMKKLNKIDALAEKLGIIDEE